MPRRASVLFGVVLAWAVAAVVAPRAFAAETAWQPLFDGKTLDGWTPKIRGHAAGIDPYGTFRVEDGLISVGYEGYERFENHFGHLFYHRPYERYELLVEYRFVGEQARGGPRWARKNSGVMFHSQSPQSMGIDQDFPISLEAQFLGGFGTRMRPTLNLCTPGTHVELVTGELETKHCIAAEAPTVADESWVIVILRVDGHGRIEHRVNDATVLAYQHPVVGSGVVSGFDKTVKVDGTPLSGGYIALQSESHPVHFRRVMIRLLD